MGNTALGWQNYVKSAVLVAGSAAPNLGVGGLQSDQGAASTGWQTVGGVVTSAGGAVLTASPLTLGQTWGAMGLFRTNITSAGVVTFQLWNTPASPVLVVSSAVTAVNGQAVYLPPAGTIADFAKILIDDPGNPDSFINVAQCFLGPVWKPLTGAGFASTLGRDNQLVEATTRGGQEYPTLYWQRRRYNVALDGVRASEVWTDIDALEQVARTGTNLLIVPDVTDAAIQNAALFGRLKPTADVSYPYQGADRRAWRASITERL